ncbi:GNAT family N-acetyltransferase [Paraburkholderia youngii]|uniref:GNAT family N-acetyltransferase n=1 Tax=Paraburkholderia youngii TaxID=2782701 RepID=UPI003D2113F2
MSKVDATNGTYSGTNFDGRWTVLGEKLESVRTAFPAPLARTEATGCELTFWAKNAELTVTALRDGQLVGYLIVSPMQTDGAILAGDVGVRKEFRRQGIATAMYDFAEAVMQSRFLPCTPHSPYAEAFWSDRQRRQLNHDSPSPDHWIIQRFVRPAKAGEGEDVYEPWPGYDKAMTQPDAERALDECVRRWPDFEFRAHHVRVHEKIAADAIAKAQRITGKR